jgi:hypothetical protein
MTTFEIISLCLGGGGLIGILGLIFALGKLFQKVETMSIDISEIKKDIKSIEQ